jgi:hypothetical protein
MPAPTRLRPTSGCLAAVVLLGLAGCSQRFEFAEVEGLVTLDGAPLPGVQVAFYPDSDGADQLPYATGAANDQGVYHLTAELGRPGALVGKNRVVVNWPLRDRGADPDVRPPPISGPPIPIPYTQAAGTPLLVEVKPGPRQTIDLPLHK